MSITLMFALVTLLPDGEPGASLGSGPAPDVSLVMLPALEGITVDSLLPGLTGLWAGTRQSGLFLLDPATGRPLRRGRPGRRIRALVADDFGLWIAANDGLFRASPDGEERPFPLPGSAPPEALARTAEAIWVGTTEGLFAWNGERWARPDPRGFGAIHALATDAEGLLWAATERGVLHRDGASWILETQPGRRGRVHALLADPSHGIWCGGDDGLWLRGPDGRWRRREGVEGPIFALARMGDGLWAGGTEGLWVLGDDGELPRLETAQLQITALATGDGGPWLGTARGLARRGPAPASDGIAPPPAAGNATALPAPAPPARSPNVWGGLFAHDGRFRLPGDLEGRTAVFDLAVDEARRRIWLATAAGLFVFDDEGELEERWEGGDGPGDGPIRAVTLHPGSGRPITAGATALARLDDDGWRRWDEAGGLPHGGLWDVLLLGDEIWTASDGGVHRLAATGWSSWTEENSELVENGVTALATDGRGGIWAAVWNGGLARFDGRGWQVFRDPDGLPDGDASRDDGLLDDAVTTCAADGRGRLWVGTSRGLCRLDGETWRDLDEGAPGLKGTMVHGLRPGPQADAMWVCTDEGVTLLSDARWLRLRFLAGATTSLQITEGPAGGAEERRTHVAGRWASPVVRDVALLGTTLCIATDRGLSALRLGAGKGGES